MDYKDKLKLAKEALDSGSYDKETIEYIFPELAESEDEKIRKELIEFVKSRGGFKQEYIAWLEKQGKEDSSIQQAYEWGYTEGKRIERKHWVEKQKFSEDYNSIDPQFGKPIEQNPAWSEEDECYMGECIGAIATKDGWSFEEKRKTKHWLKSIKDKVLPQPKQEWNEEDDWIKTKIIKVLLGCETFLTSEETNECINWIKSIKQRLKGKS